MRKLTKADLEKLAKEIIAWAEKYELGHDWLLFYNGKKYDPKGSVIEKNVNPIDFCEYFPEKFIMGMAYDGTMYEIMNDYFGYSIFEKLEKILSSYGLYLEHCDSCHACMCEAVDMEVEYTICEREKIIRLISPGRAGYEHDYSNKMLNYPRELDSVMNFWMEESTKVGDIGGCVLGEYLEFVYKGKRYRMCSQSPYQGEASWIRPLPEVKAMLKGMGAKEIYFNYERLD